MNSEEIKSEVKKAALQLDNQAEVILFGSHARGDNRKNSDWDFLILTQKNSDEKSKELFWQLLYQVELKSDEVISPLIRNKNDWEQKKFLPIYEQVKKDGVRV
jgi:predicted nucleotidyltransferase